MAESPLTIGTAARPYPGETVNGDGFFRYNHDGYGETPDGGPFPGDGNTGRLWPLLAG